ncbi:glycosyltransferase family 4 protein [Gloeocapsopsis dulcis]|uniref:Glycosyltransferase n=1 Tax=Gloeocapsopsis dulcis AAB1 = 1H9 TaxID=1433147 RepID=A0A6N8G101_9CHRO|nr:glycosyltransferase family 4 protein [Gloeocapsopsis dulcis]MUL39003.1 glycosyltransferase [Gloeocapsopsis dulcis AAB1 = 1H9]WNN90836.1 glycosyltransferase family 4 protein [Gloeocapsopsis dulcis]
MQLTLVTATLTCGGAERVLVLLTEGFLQRGYTVSVITLSGKDIDFYKLPSQVERIALDVMGTSSNIVQAVKNNFYRLSHLRKAIQSTQPDAVISFVDQTNISTLLSLTKTNYPIIVTEHCDVGMKYGSAIWEKLRRLSYPHAAKVVSVSRGVESAFDWLPERKKTVIYNPLIIREDPQSQMSLPQGIDPQKQWIVAMGRLTYQKGFDLLLSAFKQIADRFTDWQLIILGEGELRQELETNVDKLGLSHQVVLPGVVNNPFAILRQAKFFAMASRFEGFPMVHGEALACGLPVICTDCPSGPKEIIRDGVDGILVSNGDVAAIASAMEHLIVDQTARAQLASRAPEVSARFSLDSVMRQWEALLDEVVRSK